MDPGRALVDWLASLPDADAIAVARWLADNKRSGPVVSADADARVFRLTRDAPAKDVAAELGMKVPQVSRAVQRHNLRIADKPLASRRGSVA